MKKNKLAAALAVASMAAFSSASFAIDQSVAPQLEIWLSGASAQDKGLHSLIQDMCKNGTASTTDLTTFANDSTTAPGAKHTAWFCTLTNSGVTGLSGSLKVLIHKRSDGGSAQGVSPLLANQAIDHMVINNSNCSAVTAGGSAVSNCTITGASLIPHISNAGVSDVNPEMFTGILNTPVGFSGVKASDVSSKLVVRPSAAVIFGVTVGKNLYQALQVAQGLTVAPASCAVGAYTDACMPSFNKEQVSSLLAGKIGDWSKFKVGTTALTAVAGVTPPTDTLVHICKRTAGSGTGAQMYAKFLNNPCTSGTLTLSTGDVDNGPIIHDVAESLDLENCNDALSKATTGVVTTATDVNGNLIAENGDAWAIGVQALEKNNTNLLDYRFVKIDGVAPTLKNTHSGAYMDWVEATWQYRTPVLGGPVAGTDTYKIIDKLIIDGSSPAKLHLLKNKTYDFGRSGYLAVSSSAFPANAVLVEAAPIMPFTHAAAGSLNNCAAPALAATATGVPVK